MHAPSIRLSAFVAGIMSFGCVGSAFAAPMYAVTDLGTPPAGADTSPFDRNAQSYVPTFNANGQVAYGSLGGNLQSGNWIANTQVIPDLDVSGTSLPGFPRNYHGGTIAFIGAKGSLNPVFSPYNPDGGGGFDTSFFGLNGSGMAVGATWLGPRDLSAVGQLASPFVYLPGTGASILPTPAFSGAAFSINSSGEIVGESQNSTFTGIQTRAYLWVGSTSTDLNTLISSASGLTLISATGVNDNGQIVGQALDAQGTLHDYLLTPTSLPTPAPEPTVVMLASLVGVKLGIDAVRKRDRSR